MEQRKITIKRAGSIERKIVTSLTQTNLFADAIAKELRGGDVLALSGQLGAGKTTFTQALARALDVTRQVTSPTFILMNIYSLHTSLSGIVQLCHIDAYRLESADELKTIGAEEYIGAPNTLTVIEWPERVETMIPKNVIWISFEHSDKVKKEKG